MTKIAVATQKGGLEDQVSSVFGRCQNFTFVETEDGEIRNSEVVANQYANATGGAGIQAAGFISKQGVDAVIAGDFGPNISSVLNQPGIKMVPATGISVRKAVEKYLAGETQPVTETTPSSVPNSSRRGGRGGGRGMGRGMGRRAMKRQIQQPPVRTSQQQTEQTTTEKQEAEEDRIQKLEERMKNLENHLEKISKGLEDLKRE